MGGEGGEGLKPEQRKGVLRRLGDRVRTMVGKNTPEPKRGDEAEVFRVSDDTDILVPNGLGEAHGQMTDLLKESGLWEILIEPDTNKAKAMLEKLKKTNDPLKKESEPQDK